MSGHRGAWARTFVGVVAAALVACVAGPQPEPPGDPLDAGVAARDAARPGSDLGPSARDAAGSSPPPMPPPPAEDAGTGDFADANMMPMPMDGSIAEADAGSPDAGPELDAQIDGATDADAASDGGVADDADVVDSAMTADAAPTDAGPTDAAPDAATD